MTTKNLQIDLIDVSTRQKRRNATSLAIGLLERIRFAEEASLERFPTNLQDGDAYANAEYSLEVLVDAIVNLSDAY